MSEPKWLERAKTDLTLHEIPGPQAATRIKQMFLTVGHPEITSDEVSWCAAATGTWLRESGYPTSEPIHLNLTGASYEKYGRSSAPKKGAIVVSTYTRLGRKDWRRHVGIMLADPRPGAKSYKIIGGNQSDEVSVINVPISKVTAVRWPELREQAETLPPVVKPIVQPPTPDKPKDDPTPEHIYERPKTTKFKECLKEVLRWEGGYSNDKYDRGGATMRGVTTSRYRSFREAQGLQPRPVRQIEDAELKEIYSTYYWKPVWGERLPYGLGLCVFDFGVNSGPTRAVRFLQVALGVRVDGEMGPITIAAAEVCDVEETIKAVSAARLQFVKGIDTYWRFGRGWTRRIHGIRRASLERVGIDDIAMDTAPEPLDDINEQSASQGRAEGEPAKVDAKTAAGVAASGAGIASAASQTPVPSAPTGTVEALSAWQQVATFFQGFGDALINHWEYFLLAGGIWALVSYGIPALYRKFRK